jgi:hypothetical protein
VALSVKVMAAVRLPTADGVNPTVIVQLLPAASELPQVFVSGKSEALAPVTAMLDIAKAAVPLFVTVTTCVAVLVPTVWLPKAKRLADSPTVAEVPVPVRLTVWGLPVALSVNITEAVLVPGALGANETLIVHWACGAIEAPHVLVMLKSPAFGPDVSILVNVSVALPTLISVADCVGLVLPIA